MVRARASMLLCAGIAMLGCRSNPPASAEQRPQASATSETPPPSEARADAAELAYLAAAADQDAILDDARTEATGCDAGDSSACRKLANRYEEGIGAPHDPARALGLYQRGCDEGLGYHCLLGGWLAGAMSDSESAALALALLTRACELDQLSACTNAAVWLQADPARASEAADLRAKACRGGYQISCDEGVEPSATPKSGLPQAEAACPASFHWSTSQSGGPRLHGTLEQIDHLAMLATTPAELSGYTTERRGSSPAGRAGTRTAMAWAEYVADERRVSISIADRSADCTLEPGTGRAMIVKGVSEGKGHAVELGGMPGIVVEHAVSVWLSDRCTLSVSAPELDEAGLIAVAEQVDLDGLAGLCRRRPAPSSVWGL